MDKERIQKLINIVCNNCATYYPWYIIDAREELLKYADECPEIYYHLGLSYSNYGHDSEADNMFTKGAAAGDVCCMFSTCPCSKEDVRKYADMGVTDALNTLYFDYTDDNDIDEVVRIAVKAYRAEYPKIRHNGEGYCIRGLFELFTSEKGRIAFEKYADDNLKEAMRCVEASVKKEKFHTNLSNEELFKIHAETFDNTLNDGILEYLLRERKCKTAFDYFYEESVVEWSDVMEEWKDIIKIGAELSIDYMIPYTVYDDKSELKKLAINGNTEAMYILADGRVDGLNEIFDMDTSHKMCLDMYETGLQRYSRIIEYTVWDFKNKGYNKIDERLERLFNYFH